MYRETGVRHAAPQGSQRQSPRHQGAGGGHARCAGSCGAHGVRRLAQRRAVLAHRNAGQNTPLVPAACSGPRPAACSGPRSLPLPRTLPRSPPRSTAPARPGALSGAPAPRAGCSSAFTVANPGAPGCGPSGSAGLRTPLLEPGRRRCPHEGSRQAGGCAERRVRGAGGTRPGAARSDRPLPP